MRTDALDSLFALLNSANGRWYGDEPVTQLAHALQCASLAQVGGAPVELVTAALFHDVGHLLHAEFGEPGYARTDQRHEIIGARYLMRWFGDAVAGPVRLHVDAKRYLCSVDPPYAMRLSQASQHSLELQGGPFSQAEARRFEALPHAQAAIALRRWDDAAKEAHVRMPPSTHFRDAVEAALKPWC